MKNPSVFTPAGFLFASRMGRLLIERNMTCAVAESCTGGMIGATCTAVAGSSAWFRGGIIAYTNAIKHRLLGVSPSILENYGAVSDETVKAMAAGAAAACSADCAISVSGIAGPGGGTPEKPVGLVYIGISIAGSVTAFRHRFSGGRTAIRQQTTHAALRHFTALLSETR